MTQWILGAVWDAISVSTPWWVWVVAGIAGALALWRFIGTKATLALIAGVLVFGAFMKGRQGGYQLAVRRQLEERKRDTERRLRINKQVAGRSPEENRKRLRKWIVPDPVNKE